MKRVLALILALVLAFSLAACGDKGASGNSGNNDGAQSGTAGGTKDGFTVLDVKKEDRVSDIEITGLKIGKDSYAQNEPITVTVTWNGTPEDSAWVGIVPADVKHGSEEENDAYDVDYRYLVEYESGKAITFEILLDPGKYTMRVNESDSGGAELAWCAFTVTGETVDNGGDSSSDDGNSGGTVPTGWLSTKTGKFYSQYGDEIYMVFETSFEGMTTTTTTATKGDKSYSETFMDGVSLGGVSVMIGDELYTIDHASSTVIKMKLDTTAQNMTNTLIKEEYADLSQLETGTRAIDGVTYDTETWVIDGVKSTLCFDGDLLAYMIGEAEGMEIVMRILEIFDSVDDSYFEIPADYQLIEY